MQNMQFTLNDLSGDKSSTNSPLSQSTDPKLDALLTNDNRYLQKLLKMLSLENESNCSNNCSGHGECFNSVCFCEVSFFWSLI